MNAQSSVRSWMFLRDFTLRKSSVTITLPPTCSCSSPFLIKCTQLPVNKVAEKEVFWSLLTVTWLQWGSSTKGALSPATAIWRFICHHPSDPLCLLIRRGIQGCSVCERTKNGGKNRGWAFLFGCREKAVRAVCDSEVLKSQSLSDEPSGLINDSRYYNILPLNGCWTGWSRTWQNNCPLSRVPKHVLRAIHFKMVWFLWCADSALCFEHWTMKS